MVARMYALRQAYRLEHARMDTARNPTWRAVKRSPAFVAGDHRGSSTLRATPSKSAQEVLLRKTADRELGDFWRNVDRPVTFFDEPSPAVLMRERNSQIL
jgi:hypothetical protein